MYLGLDIGGVRVGVASLNGLEGVPAPLGTFLRSNGQAEAEILRLIVDREVKTLVVGWPLNDASEKTPQCDSVERFCKRISRRAPGVEITYVDEYASTVEAEERFFEARAGQSRKRRDRARERGVLDALAAVTILEIFKNSLQGGNS